MGRMTVMSGGGAQAPQPVDGVDGGRPVAVDLALADEVDQMGEDGVGGGRVQAAVDVGIEEGHELADVRLAQHVEGGQNGGLAMAAMGDVGGEEGLDLADRRPVRGQ